MLAVIASGISASVRPLTPFTVMPERFVPVRLPFCVMLSVRFRKLSPRDCDAETEASWDCSERERVPRCGYRRRRS